MPGWALIAVFVVLLFLRVPVGVALGAAAVFLIWQGDLGVGIVSFNFQAGISNFPLLAIPFFILAGAIMDRAGIARRIVRLAMTMFRRRRSGAAVTTIVVAMFWGAVSGSGPATVAALGPILIPMMTRQGYGRPFGGALVAAASEVSIIIPPSIAFIIYATIISGSVAEQFVAGILPGMLTGLFLGAAAVLVVHLRGWGAPEDTGDERQSTWQLARDAFWGLMTPVIILGGIYGGLFTPTEAAAVGVFWALFVGVAIYRTLGWRDIHAVLVTSAVSSGVILLIVAWAGLFAWAANTIGLVDTLSNALLTLADNGGWFLLLLNLMWLVLGMMMDAISIYYLTLPVLIPVMQHLGWDPVWFGVMMTLNLAIGQITPPVAVNLFVSARVSGEPIEKIWVAIVPFLIASILVLGLITYVPWISQVLPALFYH
ncbi:TRAP transporter large permease [Salinisphaera aquimarina]|uniref:TRAP transporter large permease protein n=1 Tax=Salinisphaera aquimarina TaxID=2094031 RepID=A0ABV7EKW8_9GAMM